MKNSRYAISLMLLLCVTMLGGCAGRARTTLAYTQPADKTVIQQATILPCDVRQAQQIVTRYFDTAFSVQPEPEAKQSELIFKLVLPQEDLQSVLDCGFLVTTTPAVNNTPHTFAAATPRIDLNLADGTSIPKPATMTAKASATIPITLASQGKGKTLLNIHAEYIVNLSLDRYVMIYGFSPVAHQRVSKRVVDEAQIVFTSQRAGGITKQFPENRYSIDGDWPIQCRSTGKLEEKIISGIMASVPR